MFQTTTTEENIDALFDTYEKATFEQLLMSRLDVSVTTSDRRVGRGELLGFLAVLGKTKHGRSRLMRTLDLRSLLAGLLSIATTASTTESRNHLGLAVDICELFVADQRVQQSRLSDASFIQMFVKAYESVSNRMWQLVQNVILILAPHYKKSVYLYI